MTIPAEQPPTVSIVIPCKGHAEELGVCLRGVTAQAIPGAYEIIVVDSAADPRVAAAVARYPQVRLLGNSSSGSGAGDLRPGPARNLGAQAAQARYLAFIDADCVPEVGWLAAAVAALEAGARLAGGPVLDLLPDHPVAAADNLLQFADLLPGRPDGPASVFPGCNLAIRRSDFHEVGGFPDTGTTSGEDVLFCNTVARCWPGGVQFVRRMQVRHHGRATLAALWRHQEQFGFDRGRLGLELRPIYRRLGRSSLLAPAVVGKRLAYIIARKTQWDALGLLRIAPLLPILLFGLAGWAKGFRRGCRLTQASGR